MNKEYYYFNPGAILRRLFPKQLSTQTMIIIWTVVFVINITVAILIQNSFIYNITDFSEDALQNHSYFKESEILSVKKKMTSLPLQVIIL